MKDLKYYKVITDKS